MIATPNQARKRHYNSYGEYSRLLIKVTSEQISDGLDIFYSDYRNRSIDVHAAFWPVLKTITGSPDEEVELVTRNLRKGATTK